MCLNVACFVFRSQRSFLGFVFYLSILTSCCFSLATVVLMPFVALRMARFSVSSDSIVSVKRKEEREYLK